MFVTRSRTLFSFATLILVTWAVAQATPFPAPVPASSTDPPKTIKAEVKFVNDDLMKVEILDKSIGVLTKHGSLVILISDIRRIECATRIPPLIRAEVKTNIEKLAHDDFATREDATDALKKTGPRAYGQTIAACRDSNPERSRRADEVVRYLQRTYPAEKLKVREKDLVVTEDSSIACEILPQKLRVKTMPFGEQDLCIADVNMMALGGSVKNTDVANAEPSPANMMAFQNTPGKEVVYKVTGAVPGAGVTGGVWGTDVYTIDSNISFAAVHAGLVQPGQTVVVRLRTIPSPQQFFGNERNGVTSSAYNAYPAGAYEFVR